MLWLRIVHVIGNIAWLGGGAVAAFAMAMLASEMQATRLAAAKALRKVVVSIVTPGMLLSLATGLTMLLSEWTTLYAKQPWMHGKLTVGLIAAAFSGVLTGRLRRAANDGGELSPKAFRTAGLVLVFSAIANVTLVIMRFGAR
jgi:uncharacterized membrane protein